MKFAFSRPASSDLASVGEWIARDNPERADTFVDEIRACCRNVARNPKAFPLDQDFASHGVRRRPFRRYVVFYRIETNRVLIIAVLHGAQDLKAILERRLN